jgi:hypothetical protein
MKSGDFWSKVEEKGLGVHKDVYGGVPTFIG